MKILGRGWQYTTCDLGNGRVLKKYNSLIAAYVVMFSAYLKSETLHLSKLPAYYRGCKETARDSMKKVTNGTLESWMMGNPKILNELDYEQDMLTPLHDRINDTSLEEAKQWVDKFVAFNKILVERSLIDKSFNITKNFAIDAQDRVVLMDLGELYSSKAAIDEQRRKRMWAYPYVVEGILREEVRTYYLEQMDKAFGLER